MSFLYPCLPLDDERYNSNYLENWALINIDIFINNEEWEIVEFFFNYDQKRILKKLLYLKEEIQFINYFKRTDHNIDEYIDDIIINNAIDVWNYFSFDLKNNKDRILYMCIENGCDEIIKTLKYDHKTFIPPICFYQAIKNNYINVIKKMIYNIPKNNPQLCNRACLNNNIEMVKLLIENDISYPDNRIIVQISYYEKYIPLLNYLRNKKCNLDWVKGFKVSCASSNMNIIKWYLNNVCDEYRDIIKSQNIHNYCTDEVVFDLMCDLEYIYHDQYKHKIFNVRYKASPHKMSLIHIKPFFDLSPDYIFKKFMQWIDKTKEEIDRIELIPQRTKEWLEARKAIVSGTKVGHLLGRYHGKSIKHALYECLYSTFSGNDATNWGTCIEPLSSDLTRVLIKKDKMKKDPTVIGVDFWEDGFKISEENPWIGVSSDGHYIVIGNDGELRERGTIELKAPYQTNDFYPECPHYYYDQFQTQSMVLNCSEIKFIVFTPKGMQVNTYSPDVAYWYGEILPELKNIYFDELFPRLILLDKGLLVENSIDPNIMKLLEYKEKNKHKFI